MVDRHNESERIIGACGIVLAALAGSSMIVRILASTGWFGVGPEIRWVDFVAIPRRVGGLPPEFFFVVLALVLAACRSSRWALVVATVLFGAAAGYATQYRLSVEAWLLVAGGVVALVASTAASNGGFRDIAAQLAADVRTWSASPLYRTRAFAAVSAIVLAGVGIRQFIAVNNTQDAASARVVAWYEAAKARVNPPPGIELTIFSDFQCPACRIAVPQLVASATAASAQTAKVTIRDFPLDTKCNAFLPPGAASLHPSACVAAVAARLVAEELPAQAEEFRAWLYANQASLTEQTIRNRVTSLGLVEELTRAEPRLLEAVKLDIQEGNRYGVFSTPSIVLNGVKLPNISPQGLAMLVRHELTGANAPHLQSRN